MLSNIKISIIALCVFLVACVGEGKPRAAKISLDSRGISYTIAKGTSFIYDIEVSYQGDVLLAGPPVEIGAFPDWLTIKNTAGDSESATYQLSINLPDHEGTFTSSIRFVSAYEYSEEPTYIDFNINLVAISPTEISFVADYKQEKVPEAQVISYENTGLTAVTTSSIDYHNSSEEWLMVNATPNGISFTVLTTDLALGSYSALITLRNADAEDIIVQVNYEILEPSIKVSPIADFNITNRTRIEELVVALDVDEGNNSYDWRASIISLYADLTYNQQTNKIHLTLDADRLGIFGSGSYESILKVEYRLENEARYKTLEIPFYINVNLNGDPAIKFPEIPPIVINNNTTNEDLLVDLKFLEGSNPKTWNISDTRGMISVEKNITQDGLAISIDKTLLESVDNGLHNQGITIDYTEYYTNKSTFIRISFDISKEISNIESITPRVIYSGVETPVKIWGENLNNLSDQYILSTQESFSNLLRINKNEVDVTMGEKAEVGEYYITVNNALGFKATTTKLIVKQAPKFPLIDLTLPNRVSSVIYDAERESFYYSSYYDGNSIYTISQKAGRWQWSAYNVNKPGGLALTVDGKKLIVGNRDCEVYKIDLEHNSVSEPDSRIGCHYEEYGFVGQFYNGLILVADTNQWPSVHTYPSWGDAPVDLPREYYPQGMVSQYNTHMIWSGQDNAYIYDARNNTLHTWGTVSGNTYGNSIFSISAKGERISHFNDIYNSQLAYIGSLDNAEISAYNKVGISPDGSKAAYFRSLDNTVGIYDISADYGPIVEISRNIAFDETDFNVDRIVFSEDNNTLFIFTYNKNTNISKMKVFSLN